MTVNMVTLPETQSGTKRQKPTTPKNDAFAIVLSTKPYKVWLFWNAYVVQRYLLQMDVFGQILHFTPLFIADLVEILPNMRFSSNITVSSTF
jgi:hypothetical protein